MKEITAEYLAEQGLSHTFPKRFWSKVDKNGPVPQHCPELGPCWIWTGGVGRYGKISSVRPKWISAHRASWVLHFGPVPFGLQVLHHCDNSRCVRPDHLWTGSQSENIKDALKKSRMSCGEDRYNAKLTEEQVIEIRQRVKNGERQRHLAREFGISQGTLWPLVHKKNWAHVI